MERDLLKSFKKSSDIKKVTVYNKQPLILCQPRKRSLLNTEIKLTNFHSKTAATYLKVLIIEIRSAFSLKNLPLLLAITALNPNNKVKKIFYLNPMAMKR